MKTYSFIVLFFITHISFSQNNHIVKTDDGRRVLLKADFTWEYIDLEVPKEPKVKTATPKSSSENSCSISKGFTEPQLNKKIQIHLKKGRATMAHVKKRVAKDFKCDIENIILLSVKETKASGTYQFCANGTLVTYKRNGYSFAKKLKVF